MENFNPILTVLDDNTYELMKNKAKKVNMNSSKYIRTLIERDVTVHKSNILSRLEEAFNKPLTVINEDNNVFKENPIKNKSEIWGMTKSGKNIYKKPKLQKTGTITTGKYNRSLRLSINEIILLEQWVNHDYFTKKQYKEYYNYFKEYFSNTTSFNTLIWNIWIGKFDEIIKQANNIKNLKYNVKNEYFYINNAQHVKFSTVFEIISIINQKGLTNEFIVKLNKSYNNINPLLFRIICLNYANSNVLSLNKNKNKEFKLNNPSKRRDFIKAKGM